MKKYLKLTFFVIKEIAIGTLNAFIMIGAGVIIASFFIYKYQLPDVSSMDKIKNPETTIIYDRTGEEILYQIHGEENRKILSHEEIPNSIKIATVAAEDKTFYSHFGVDFGSIFRAFLANLENKKITQGASTITQQLARNVYLSREKTLTRKVKEALIAIKIEKNFSKEEILDLYLNEVPYGSNAYGIESAAEIYFQKKASELTLDEAVFLSALPKAPTYYSPYGSHSRELAKRQERIYGRIKETNPEMVREIQEAKAVDTFSKVAPFREKIIAPHFVFYVIEELEKKYGRDFLAIGGLKVRTTLDLSVQKKAEAAVFLGAKNNLSRGAENAALVAINPKTGEIIAMVGSRDYFSQDFDGEVNVTTSLRQPGSSIKPVIYATAFENGYQPETLIADVETDFGPDGSGKDYIPRNYDGKFHGVLPMRKTLAMSLNIPAVKTLDLVGVEKAINMAERLGIETFDRKKKFGLSLAIGGAEVRPIELTSAFSVFANDGKRNEPFSIFEISGKKGIEFLHTKRENQAINPQIARKISSILSDNDARKDIFGTNSPLNFSGRSVAAKTGTTQDFKDAWAVGFTPDISVGVWCGNNDGRPMKAGSDGVFLAAPIWRNFMDSLDGKFFSGNFIPYEKVVTKESMALGKKEKKISEKEDDKKSKKKKEKG